MLEQPSENVKLNFDQLQAEDVSKKRLVNLESEISIGNRNLKIIKGDTDRATKENIYQNELLTIVTAQVVEKQINITRLDADIVDKTVQLNDLISKIRNQTEESNKTVILLKDREDAISAMEKETRDMHTRVLNLRDDLNTELKDFKEKIVRLKEVIKDF